MLVSFKHFFKYIRDVGEIKIYQIQSYVTKCICKFFDLNYFRELNVKELYYLILF